jgi:Abnormal spindle-like microcephaly-assoc'd, ASPM-SPD-2-Hydin
MRRNYLLLATVLLSIFYLNQGYAQTIQVTPATMTFPDVQPVGSPFPGVLQVKIQNTSTQAVNFTSATVTGDFFFGPDPFTQSVVFGQLIPGGTLSFALYFNASASGPRTGTLTLVDSAAGSPQTFMLSGTGFVGAMAQSDSPFVSVSIPTLGTAITGHLQIVSVGNQPVTVTGVSIAASGFSQTNTCGAAMAQGEKCQINVTFDPAVAGTVNGTLTVTNTGAVNPIVLPVIGNAADFSLTIDPAGTSATISPGQQATYPFIVAGLAPGQGLDAVTFTCAGLPPGAACMVKSGPFLLPGPLSAELVISTTSNGSAALHGILPVQGWPWVTAVLVALVIPRKTRRAGLLLMFACLFAGLVACGSSRSGSSTPAGTYSITVTGARNGLTHSFPVTLIVR